MSIAKILLENYVCGISPCYFNTQSTFPISEKVDWTKVKEYATKTGIGLSAAALLMYGVCNPEKVERLPNLKQNVKNQSSYQTKE